MVTATEMGTWQKGERPRRFTLGDGLLVVAALAAGFAMVRQWANPHWCAEPPFFAAPTNASFARTLYYGVAVGVSWSIPFAIAMMPAVLAARLRKPRPPLAQIAEGPGTVACAAALLGMVLRPTQEVLFYALDYLTHSNSSIHLPSPPFVRLFGSSRYSPRQIIHDLVLEDFPRATAPAVGAAVLIAWLVLVGIGRFRPERDWIDRTGRAPGSVLDGAGGIRQRDVAIAELPQLISDRIVTHTGTSLPQGSDRPRRFTVRDGLLVVAALAAGFAMVRQWTDPRSCAESAKLFYLLQPTRSTARQVYHAVAVGGTWTIPFAMAFTPVILVARFFRPRPRFERIAEQPGIVACAAAVVIMVIRPFQEVPAFLLQYLSTTSSLIRLPSPPFIRWNGPPSPSLGQIVQNVVLEAFPFYTAPLVGIAVLVAWLVLLANGRFRPEPDWVDRSGRVLGIYWMALGVFTGAMSELWKFIG